MIPDKGILSDDKRFSFLKPRSCSFLSGVRRGCLDLYLLKDLKDNSTRVVEMTSSISPTASHHVRGEVTDIRLQAFPNIGAIGILTGPPV